MSNKYRPAEIEQQAQTYWETHQRFVIDEDPNKEKFYALAMFPYPSGKLHMGHARVYTITDLLARFYRMCGKQVLHPIGWDAFGLPAENAAIEKGDHPAAWTYSNIDHMRKQLKRLGYSYDWRREFATCDPSYYKWEQWLFTEFFKRGLAYRKESWVNWDPVDQTVLANEQVENGRGWRSGALVERKKMMQWNLRITAYADELLNDLQTLNWPANIIAMQTNWIGKSVGALIDFALNGRNDTLRVFTTRPDTIMGATFMAIAADHPLMDELCADNAELNAFAAKCRTPHEPNVELPKKGMPTGLSVTHPLSGDELPVWVANFVLMEYGTGAIMSVPAHDQRDWEFATTYKLPIKQVIAPLNGECDTSQAAYSPQGICMNSGKYDGLDFASASKAIIADLQGKGSGKQHVNWRLRDWGVSRQRYWGAPIPIIHCPDCGEVPVPLQDLPVELPQDVVLDGKGSALAAHSDFVDTNCPQCGTAAKRDTDTFDTFFESSWYQSRFASYDCDQAMLDNRASYWCPVDQYVGGIEHAILHLLYARFFHKVMRDLLRDDQANPILTSDEPFANLLAQGMVLAPVYLRQDGAHKVYANEQELKLGRDERGIYGLHKDSGERFDCVGVGKMSKSKRNGVDPERVITKYGADTVRLYMLFTAPPEQTLEWSEHGVVGMHRFLNRFWNLCQSYIASPNSKLETPLQPDLLNPAQRELWRKSNKTIQKVYDDIYRRRAFNTAIAAIMELTNSLHKFDGQGNSSTFDHTLGRLVIMHLVCLLAPFTPHICHSLWQQLGQDGDLLDHPFPQADQAACKEDTLTMVVQINGRLRARLAIAAGASKEEMEQAALSDPKIITHLGKATPAKIIVVPGKLVNLVVKG